VAYTVFIPTAGTGSRLGGITKYINKSLVSIENKPTIARIMDMFPVDTEYVIAVGYKGEIVKEYLELACSERKITVVDVFPFEGEGSGLGYTIGCCKEYLQKPFIFCSCDTLVSEAIPDLSNNWMGWDDRDNKQQYRTITVDNDTVKSINEKSGSAKEGDKPYIGMAGIKDYEIFWKRMEDEGENAVLQGESAGLRALVELSEVKAQKFTWFDTGVTVELDATRRRYHNEGGPNILPKADEAIWFLDNKVIKFSNNEEFIKDRVERSKLLKGFVPSVTGYTRHMYAYEYVQGNVLSKCVSLPVFKQLLNTSKMFWKEAKLSDDERKNFYENCMDFYKVKTYKRVNQFFETFGKNDIPTVINHVWYGSVTDMLRQVDWDYMANGLPGQFHGDFHFENILYDEASGEFEFLDWRQNFGGSLSVGDIYYDLGKLLHGLIMCHELVAKDQYEITWEGNEIVYDFNRKKILVECENYYYRWLENNGFDVNKVKTMTALIFLNIAALHHYPYSLVLMALGKEMLQNTLDEK
jgi:choline kinase